MQKRLAPILVVLAAVVLVGFGILAVHNRAAADALPTVTPLVLAQAATPTAAPTTVSTSTTNTASSESGSVLTANGTLLSANQASLSFPTGGRIQTLTVKEGDHVVSGTVLMTLDTSLLKLAVTQAQAAFDLAQANLDKTRQGPTADDLTVAKMGVNTAKAALDQAQAAYDKMGGDTNPYIVASPAAVALQQATSAYRSALAQLDSLASHPTDTELRAAQAAADQALAALNLARQNLANATLTAPFDGTVVAVNPKSGEFAAPGAPVAVIADLTHMQVQVNLDENSLAGVAVNEPVTVTVAALPGASLTGHVSKIGHLGTNVGGVVSVPVTIDLDPTAAAVYPGLTSAVDFAGVSQ